MWILGITLIVISVVFSLLSFIYPVLIFGSILFFGFYLGGVFIVVADYQKDRA